MNSIWENIDMAARKVGKYPQLDVWIMKPFVANVYEDGFVDEYMLIEVQWPAKQLTEDDHRFHIRKSDVRIGLELELLRTVLP